MAPSRKRGASRAAAAARRQWKVGDLVLAKLKGFPAWPATVSEPQKWDLKSDLKKVLVYFFGTQQIAFCNPGDIEPFTEEKKQSLLTKRQGKSADFVRALEEIVDSFDKAKKQDYVNDFSSSEAFENGGNSVESSQNDIKICTVALGTSVTCRDVPTLRKSDTADVQTSCSLDDKEVLLKQPVSNVEKPIIATYTSRKRSGGSRSRKCVAQKKVVSPETPKNSSQLASGTLQNSTLLSQNSRENVGELLSDSVKEGLVRRTKRVRKSPEALEDENGDSSAFVSNCSVEDNVSEIVTVDSGSVNLNDVSTVDSYKIEHCEAAVERLGEEAQLAKGLGFQIKAVVTRKKRKPNRKRATNEASEPTARTDTGRISEVGADNIAPNLQCMSQNGREASGKEDGDEHLPLVKRARVRMGEVPSSREERGTYQSEGKTLTDGPVSQGPQNSVPQAEERTFGETAVNMGNQVSPSVNSDIDFPATKSSTVNETLNNMSPSEDSQIPEGKTTLSKVKDGQLFGHLADGESALPPSKRLHRALEAMSANVAEETLTLKTCFPDSAPKDPENVEMEEQNKDSIGTRVPVLCSSFKEALEEGSISSTKADGSDTKIEVSSSSEASMNEVAENINHGSETDLCRLGIQPCTDDTASVQGRTLVNVILDAENQLAVEESNQVPFDQQSPLLEDGEPEILPNNMEVGTPGKDLGACEKDSENIILHAVEGVEGNERKMLQVTLDASMSDDVELHKSKIDEHEQPCGGQKLEKDMLVEASGITFSDDHCSDKDALGSQPVTLPADEESPAGMSPTTNSMRQVSTSESANFNQNSGGSSPNINSDQRRVSGTTLTGEEKIDSGAFQRPKSVGRCSSYAEGQAALSSFEEMLGLLTRTKESIGRATRMAMDCAKFGASEKVMEILARTLECESSLHKRVDLFFLVDSVAQCSRGLKGDVSGAYTSAIKAILPRLLASAAPPGSLAQENRRQCVKVLRLWLQRRILPESFIRHHIRELDSLGASTSAAAYSRRSARTERALDDPIRDMEGMHVDEYGSNSSFQLPGFCMPRMLKDEDEGSDSDGGSFEAVTPEHPFEATLEEREYSGPTATEKHTHILEDVDGELEMEDVAPTYEVEMSSSTDNFSHGQFEQQFSCQYTLPPLPQEVPPSCPPLPSSPPPPPPLPPLPPAVGHQSCGTRDAHVSNSLDARSYRNSHCHPSECSRDQADMQFYDTCNTSGRGMNNGHHVDGPSYRHRSHPPRPPSHLPPPNHFSYVHGGGQHIKSRRETPPPPSYSSHRYHSSHDSENGNFYNNHDRMRPDPYEFGENWRYGAPPYPGHRYPEKSRSSYEPAPYSRPSREPRLPHHQGWQYPPRGVHHREFMHSDGPISVANRGPNMWRHR